MTTELTDEQYAAACRRLAGELHRATGPTDDIVSPFWSEFGLARKADELDPPKPKWDDGGYAWVPGKYGRRHLCRRSGGKWIDSLALDGSVTTKVSDDNVTGEVEPLRVLAADEIALPISVFNIVGGMARDAERARSYADELSHAGYSVGPKVFRAYADALDAESGDR